jgi:hypothetical protein
MKTTNKTNSYQPSPSGILSIECPTHQQILDRYGQDALCPRYLEIQTEEGTEFELVPKMRFGMTCQEWDDLSVDFRLFVFKSFYGRL